MKKLIFPILLMLTLSTNVFAEELQLTLNGEQTTNGAIFSGETNLPEGTKLGINIEKNGKLKGQDFNIFVHNEKYRSASFTAHGEQLSGKYKVTLFTSLNKLWQSNDILLLLNNYHGDNIKSGEIWKKIEMVKYFDFKSEKNKSKSFQSKTQIDFSSAIDIVKNTTSSNGSTLEIFFKKKVSIPAVKDLGWEASKVNGDFIVKKTIQVDGLRSPTVYKWSVSGKGIIEPLNGHAIGATQ